MDKILKKVGMSDTKYQLKFATPSQSSKKSIKQKEASQSIRSPDLNDKKSRICGCKQYQSYNQINSKVSFQQIKINSEQNNKIRTQSIQNSKSLLQSGKQRRSTEKIKFDKSFTNKIMLQSKQRTQIIKTEDIGSKQTEKIEQLISFLKQKLAHKCLIQNHQHNKISYVCLESNCSKRIGCSYCFLHSHQNHLKTQIFTCINDLQELNFKVKANQKLFHKKISYFYEQFTQKIQAQLKNIRQEFQTNIAFLKIKVQNQFQNYFKSKYQSYLEKNETVSQFQIDKFLNETNQNDFQKTLNNRTIKLSQKIQAPSSKDFNEMRQKQILNNLTTLSIQEVYEYLRRRLEIIHFQSSQSNILVQFFEEMNSSITHLFSAFKRNLPKIFTEYSNMIQKPNIIRSRC